MSQSVNLDEKGQKAPPKSNRTRCFSTLTVEYLSSSDLKTHNWDTKYTDDDVMLRMTLKLWDVYVYL